MGLGQPNLPWDAGLFYARKRRGPGPAIRAADQDDVRMGLGNAGRDGPDSGLGNQLHADTRVRIRVLEIEDQLGQVFDRIDVMVRRRRDKSDAWSRIPDTSYPGVDLVAGKLTAFAGLSALG